MHEIEYNNEELSVEKRRTFRKESTVAVTKKEERKTLSYKMSVQKHQYVAFPTRRAWSPKFYSFLLSKICATRR